jgi:hypothetical protein
VKDVHADKPALGAVSLVPSTIIHLPLHLAGELRLWRGDCAKSKMDGINRQIGYGHSGPRDGLRGSLSGAIAGDNRVRKPGRGPVRAYHTQATDGPGHALIVRGNFQYHGLSPVIAPVFSQNPQLLRPAAISRSFFFNDSHTMTQRAP